MPEIKKFAIIGGDMRLYYLSQEIASLGYEVTACGFDNIELNVNCCSDISKAIQHADALILPLPISLDGVNINAPFSYINIPLAETLAGAKKGQYVFGGQISEEIKILAKIKQQKLFDYYDREEFTVKNAIPTAEGAIQIAMEQMPSTVNGSKCLVTGYGRIAKALIKMLDGLGADLTVAARKPWDLAWITSFGYNAIHVSELGGTLGDYEIIFNTVPAKIFDEQMISRLRKDCFVIDLASKPGGVDFDAAKQAGIHVRWALSLPGKVAPMTAGRIIKDTIFNIIKEESACQN